MPSATDRIQEAREQAGPDELPYISKSRLKTYVSCPRKFYWNYIVGIKPKDNYHFQKGSRIHLVYELYYENLLDYYTGEFVDHELPRSPRELTRFLPEEALLYADWLPYVGSFLLWELERAANSTTIKDWLPVEVEGEAWDYSTDPPKMGFADVIVPAASVEEVDTDDGVVIVDFKTGKTPDEKYREEGIFLEGTFYTLVFEDEYDIAGVAGFYPKNNDFIVSDPSAERRAFANQQITEMLAAEDRKERFPTETGPLCKYGPEEGENQCAYYDICHAGQEWGAPTENWDEFVEDVQSGKGFGYLAGKYYDGDADSLGYWKWKADQDY